MTKREYSAVALLLTVSALVAFFVISGTSLPAQTNYPSNTQDTAPFFIGHPLNGIGGTCQSLLNVRAGYISVLGEVITCRSQTPTGAAYWTSAAAVTHAQTTMGGNALAAGACDTTKTVTVLGAASGMNIEVTPEGSPGAGTFTQSWISSANTVSVQVCDAVAGTPTSRTYDIRVVQ